MTHLSSESKPKWQLAIEEEDWKNSISNTQQKENEKVIKSRKEEKSSWSCNKHRKTKRARL